MGYVLPPAPPRGSPAFEAWERHVRMIAASMGIREDGSLTPAGRAREIVGWITVGALLFVAFPILLIVFLTL